MSIENLRPDIAHWVVAALLLVNAVTAQAESEKTPRQLATEYFQTYAERQDFDKLMSFYAEDATFTDVLTEINLDGKAKITEFLDWSRGSFSVKDNAPSLTISRQVVAGNTAITEGEFSAFSYDGNELGPWEFVIWLEFNQQGLIQRHTDWINYAPKQILLNIESPD